MTYKLPEVLELDHDKWICGLPNYKGFNKNSLGKGSTQLKNQEGFMCCLGQFLLQAGVDSYRIYCVGEPADLEIENELVFYEDGSGTEDGHCSYINSDFATKAMDINDDENMSIEQKIRRLQKLCEENGHTLKLKNFPESFNDDKLS